MVLKLNSRDDVTGALRSPSSWFWGSTALEIGASYGTEAQRDALCRRMAFWLSVCGCQPAALLAVCALVWRGWFAYSHGATALWVVAGSLGAAISAALTAKLSALIVSRGIFAFELLRLRSALQ